MKLSRILGAVGASIALLSASAAFADEGITGALHHTAAAMRHEGHRIHKGWHYIKISGIVLTLTSTAASALDATFGTSLFKPGLELGTASTLLRF